ncbi:hypothetical protein Sjap_005552 [Stephania japonica]|uniref:LOB domain-containing protein n=1 Tax=Stephania japonica TaxID=461633 RepID=A0AAP0K5R0_9MAGN
MDAQMDPMRRVRRPCAACRMLRRRCDDDCLLAPYFPLEEVESFAVVHKVFGASNVIKMLQVVEERKREDAVKSMVYEARTRLRDPVYASAGAIFHLQKHVQDLLEQLALTRARILESQGQANELLSSLMDMQYHHQPKTTIFENAVIENGDIVLDDNILGSNLIEFPAECYWNL